MSTQNTNFEQPTSFAFTDENLAEIKAIWAKYPEDRKASATMPMLTIAQKQHGGWLPTAAMDVVADMVGLSPMKVYEVATFYTMYKLAPVGEHNIEVCTNIACILRGSDEIIKVCKNKLGVAVGETTKDGKFTLSEAECLGACVNAPMMQIGDDYYEDLDQASVEKIIDGLARGEKVKTGPQQGRHGAEPAGGLTSLKGEAPNNDGGDT